MGFIKTFIERPIFLLMIEVFLIVVGVIGYTRLGVDLFPDVEPPVVTIQTAYPGAGPEEIESLVTKVIEEEVNQIGGIERLVSTSREGLSQIVVEFELERDAKQAQIDVRDKVSRVRPSLPDDIEEPLLQRLDFADRPILQLALKNKTSGGKEVSEAQLYRIADERVKPMIQQLDGVGQVNLFGGQQREVQVNIDLAKLKTWKMTPTELSEAIRKSNVNIPAGEFNEYPESRSIRVLGEYPAVADIAATVVKVLPGGKTVTVDDVATVIDTYRKRESFARLSGQPVVLMEIKKVSDGNTVIVSERLRAELARINQSLPSGLELAAVYDGAERIRMSLDDVMETLIIAAILAVFVVYVFLGSWQSTFITGISLPSVIITSFFALYLFGFTLNIMTLLGLTLAVGLLLDDAIVVRENIWRKIEEGMKAKDAAYEGTREVYLAVLATSLTVMATFLPVLLIPGVVGRFFSAFALTVCLCVFFSTIDALTVAPTLSALLMTKQKPKTGRLMRVAERLGRFVLYTYESWLAKAMMHPKKVLAAATAIFLFSLVLPKWIGFTFLPEDDSGEIEVYFEAPPGTTIDRTNELAREMTDNLRTLPHVKMTSTRVGSDLGEKNVGRIYIELVGEDKRDLSTSQIKTLVNQKLDLLARREGLTKTVGKPDGGGSQGKPVQLIIEGNDNEVLTALTEKIIRVAEEKVPGAINMETNLKPGRDEWQLRVRRSSLSAFALDTQIVGDTLRGLYQGVIAGPYREDGEEYDIRVQLPEGSKVDIDTLKHLTVTNRMGQEIPLLAVVDPVMGKSPTKLVRIDQQRAARIQADLAPGAPLGQVVKGLSETIGPLLPQGYRFRFQGRAESMNDLKVGALTAIFLGGLFIYMIMASLYESLIIPFSILMTLPMAIVGAMAALLLTGKFLDVYSVIGLILLMGLVGKNAIVLVDYAKQLMDEGVDEKQALLQAGVRRFRPIMMTVLSTVAGMLPIALGVGELNKFRAGMGIAAIGGLLSSTFLSLLVVPCFYLLLSGIKRRSVSMINQLKVRFQSH